MTTICLVNQAGLTTTEMQILAKNLSIYANLVATDWKLEAVSVLEYVSTGAYISGAFMVYITNKNRHNGAAGYHTILNGSPVAFCAPDTAKNRFGTYRKPWVIKGKTILQESFRPGLLTVLCHEVAEMLIDPNGNRQSDRDSHMRHWLMEIGDHCFGGYFTDEHSYVYPDYTLPSFYNVEGIAPYTHLNAVKTPFTFTPKGYGYWVNPVNGQLIKL